MYSMNDKELFPWIRENLYVPAVCDILDDLGYRNQAMHQRLRPLDENCCTIVGRARTMRWLEVDHVGENPYGMELEFMDSLRENDVVVHSNDPNGTNAPWGELMTTAAKHLGAAGCICDSQIRDCLKNKSNEFPGVLRRYPPARFQRQGPGSGLRCPGTQRRGIGTPGRIDFRGFRRNCGSAESGGRKSI